MCLFLASDSSKTIEVIIIKLGTVTASDMRRHHVLIMLTLTFVQGLTDLNHENNKLYFRNVSSHAHLAFVEFYVLYFMNCVGLCVISSYCSSSSFTLSKNVAWEIAL